jgi:hypothetical protein
MNFVPTYLGLILCGVLLPLYTCMALGILKSFKQDPAGSSDPYIINYQWPTLLLFIIALNDTCFVHPWFTVFTEHVIRQSKRPGAHIDVHFYPNLSTHAVLTK